MAIDSTEPRQVPVFTEPFMREQNGRVSNSPVWWEWLNEVRRSINEGIINVKHPYFGAKGDGVTLDDDAIAAAIAYASVKGGVLFFPPGTYMVSRPVVLPDNGFGFSLPRIWGAGMYISGLKAKNGSWSGAAVLVVDGQATITDFFVNGNSQTSVNGISLEAPGDSEPTYIERCSVSLCPGSGFITDGAQVMIDSCFFNTNGTAVNFNDFAQGSMLHKSIVLGANPCLLMTNQGGGSNEGQSVADCAFLPNPGVGTNIGALIEEGVELTFRNCVIEGPGTSTGKSVWINATNARSIHLTDCWLGSGLRVEGGANNISVHGCTFPGGAVILMSANTPGAIHGVTILGNHMYEDQNTVADKIVLDGVQRLIFHGNIVRDNSNSVFETGGANIWIDGSYLDKAGSTVSAGVTWGMIGGTDW